MLESVGPGLLSLSEKDDCIKGGEENLEVNNNISEAVLLNGGKKKSPYFNEVSVKYFLMKENASRQVKPKLSELVFLLKKEVVPSLNAHAAKYKILKVDYSTCIVTFRVTSKFWRQYGPQFFTSVDDDGLWPVEKNGKFYFFSATIKSFK